MGVSGGPGEDIAVSLQHLFPLKLSTLKDDIPATFGKLSSDVKVVFNRITD